MNNTTKRKTYWISLLKFISMLGIFSGHYFGIVKYSSSDVVLKSEVFFVIKYFNLFFNENLFMLFFCFISGYLAYNNSDRIITIMSLVKKVVIRYFRFWIPIALCTIYIYLINLFFGSNILVLSSVFKNNWITPNENYSPFVLFISSFKTIIISDSTIASPLWMLAYIYRTNILLYVYIYIKNKFNNIISLITLGIFIFLTILLNGRSIGLIIWIGFFYAQFEKVIINNIHKYKTIFIILSSSSFIIYDLVSIIRDYFVLRLAVAIIFVTCFSNINFKKKIEHLLLNDISFIFFIIHFPIICSLTGYIVKILNINDINKLSIFPFIPTLVFCLFSSLILNVLYSKIISIFKFIK